MLQGTWPTYGRCFCSYQDTCNFRAPFLSQQSSAGAALQSQWTLSHHGSGVRSHAPRWLSARAGGRVATRTTECVYDGFRQASFEITCLVH